MKKRSKLIAGILALIAFSSLPSGTGVLCNAESDLARPSIVNKDSPDIVVEEGAGGQKYAADVKYEGQDELRVIKFEVTVTSYANAMIDVFEEDTFVDRSVSIQTKIKNDLVIARQEIITAVHLDQLKTELSAQAQKLNPLYDESVYTVTDLFDVSVNVMPNEYVKVTFKPDANRVYTPGNTVFIHRDSETGKWKMAEIAKISSGNATIKFDSLCPVAILQIDEMKAKALISSKQNEEKGEYESWWLFILATIDLILIFVISFVDYLRENKNFFLISIISHASLYLILLIIALFNPFTTIVTIGAILNLVDLIAENILYFLFKKQDEE